MVHISSTKQSFPSNVNHFDGQLTREAFYRVTKMEFSFVENSVNIEWTFEFEQILMSIKINYQ